MQDQYLNLLRDCLLDRIYWPREILSGRQISSYEMTNGIFHPDRAHTMIGVTRMNNIRQCIESVLKDKIEGDLIETGVWRGGATIFMRGILKAYDDNRKVFVADSFEGLPLPDPRYSADIGDRHHQMTYLAVGLEEVKSNFEKYGLLDDNVVFLKGWFENTLPGPVQKLSILRLDGDMYSSTIHALEALYDKLSIGGFAIIDDYGLPGCMAAVNDFRNKRKIDDQLVQIDDGRSVYWRKK